MKNTHQIDTQRQNTVDEMNEAFSALLASNPRQSNWRALCAKVERLSPKRYLSVCECGNSASIINDGSAETAVISLESAIAHCAKHSIDTTFYWSAKNNAWAFFPATPATPKGTY
jgi:hypothetical protein